MIRTNRKKARTERKEMIEKYCCCFSSKKIVKVTLDEEFEKMRNTHEHKRQKTLYYWEKIRAYVR